MKRAIVIAIGPGYAPPNNFSGPENDRPDAINTLNGKGFSCISLADPSATKAAIWSQLQQIKESSVSGDAMALYYSGHGAISQGHECIVPVDWETAGFITDDELITWVNGFQEGVTLDLIFDCCFGGVDDTIAAKRPKPMPKPNKKCRNPQPRVFKGGDGSKVKSQMSQIIVPGLKYASHNACLDTQYAYNGTVNGLRRGIFSYYWLNAAKSTHTRLFDMTYTQGKVAAIVGTNQTPQLYSTEVEANQQPFT
jgi:hypothetical protein